MENLSRWIWNRLSPDVDNLFKVSVYRDSSGDACTYWGEEVAA
jgi:6-pyruvoyltetrahydropterin/6-carboxytetrahydropterin synthase